MNRLFVLSGLTYALFIAASASLSPLYAVYQGLFHFTSITLTLIFAVYALAVLGALLVFGKLSDFIGRRPIIEASLAIEAVSMAVFALAGGVPWLMAGRVVQGFATGLVTAALTATLIDSEPKNRRGLAPLVNTTVPVAGVGVGALASGILVEWVAWPTHLVFWILCGIFVGMLAGFVLVEETGARRPGWRQSLKPVISVPPAAREPMVAVGPSLIASWALAGLYLSLGPSVAAEQINGHSHLVGGLAIFALSAAALVSSILFRSRPNAQMVIYGTIVASLGLAVTAASVAWSIRMLFFAGSALAGLGFGPAFTASFRHIMAHAPDDKRAGLASAVYLAVYLAFGVPAVIAGIGAANIGLNRTVVIYAIVAIALYLLTFGLLVGSQRMAEQESQSDDLNKAA